MRVHAIGRRTGKSRPVMVGYFEDGPNLVALATNGWAGADPDWWLNLQAHPDVVVDLVGETRSVRARAAVGDERARFWNRWRSIDKGLDGLAARRPKQTAVVVFEPAPREP